MRPLMNPGSDSLMHDPLTHEMSLTKHNSKIKLIRNNSRQQAAVEHWSRLLSAWPGGLPSLHTPKLALGQETQGHKVSAAEASLGWSYMNTDVPPNRGLTVHLQSTQRAASFSQSSFYSTLYLSSKCCGPGTPLPIRVAGGLESCLTLVNPWTAARQAPLSMGFPKQEYRTGLPFSSPRDLILTQGSNPHLLHGKRILYH